MQQQAATDAYEDPSLEDLRAERVRFHAKAKAKASTSPTHTVIVCLLQSADGTTGLFVLSGHTACAGRCSAGGGRHGEDHLSTRAVPTDCGRERSAAARR
jgi:hypothetical protein|eukprot:COSAG06_NODE_1940_length_8023_cov_11.932988_8_plen_100_part_00